MPIQRSAEQKSKTLVEFYTELTTSEDFVSQNTGNAMLRFIEMMNETFKESTIYGLTSHYHLMLLASDKRADERYITVTGTSDGTFIIEYKIPADISPWPNAIVRGAANNIEEAKEFIIIAMTESRGWQNNSELKKLYDSLRIISRK